MRNVQFVSGGVAGSVIYGPYDSNPGSRRVHYAAGATQPAPSSFGLPSLFPLPFSFSFFFAVMPGSYLFTKQWVNGSFCHRHPPTADLLFFLTNAIIFHNYETIQLLILLYFPLSQAILDDRVNNDSEQALIVSQLSYNCPPLPIPPPTMSLLMG